jgi:hypothetical protein
MFDLERAIAEWRRQLADGGIDLPEVLDELESHVREDAQQQMRSGSDPQQAFNAAVQQLGPRDALKTEFKKTGRTAEVLEKLMGLVSIILVAFIIWMSGYTFLQMEMSPSEQVVAYAAVAFTLLTACAWRYAVPFLPVLSSRGKRITAGLVCVVLGVVFSNLFSHFILPHFEDQDGQIPALGFWAVFPVALFACLGLALMMSADDREHWKMRRVG